MDCSKIAYLMAAGLLSVPLSATIQVTENFAVEGFIDMSYSGDDATGSEDTFGLDQAEIDFLFTYDAVSARVDINGFDEFNTLDLEQAFVTYSFENGVSITGGKYLSYLGWEAAEPTGLYQYSYAYGVGGYIPGYHNGVKLDFASEMFEFGVSLVEDLAVGFGSGAVDFFDDYGSEVFVKLMPMEGLTLFAAWAHDEGSALGDVDVYNFWASYEIGSLLLAGEFNFIDMWGVEGKSALVMAYYSITDKLGLTVRWGTENWDDTLEDNSSYTISPSYALSDNLLILGEIKLTDWDSSEDVTSWAVEVLFTF